MIYLDKLCIVVNSKPLFDRKLKQNYYWHDYDLYFSGIRNTHLCTGNKCISLFLCGLKN